ncbi:Speedy protein C [Nymphon striatum]|nr:Speedy protein C [Nymphon striatum]
MLKCLIGPFHCLAHDMEEDDEFLKIEILQWAYGLHWKAKCRRFLHRKELIWKKMGFRALVSLACCIENNSNFFVKLGSTINDYFLWDAINFRTLLVQSNFRVTWIPPPLHQQLAIL